MVIFNSYVKLPEGKNTLIDWINVGRYHQIVII